MMNLIFIRHLLCAPLFCCALLLAGCAPNAESDWDKRECDFSVAKLDIGVRPPAADPPYPDFAPPFPTIFLDGKPYTGCTVDEREGKRKVLDIVEGEVVRTRVYYAENGRLKEDHDFRDYAYQSRVRTFYANGQIQREVNFRFRRHSGYKKAWYENGQQERLELFVGGYRRFDEQWDSLGKLTSWSGNEIEKSFIDTLSANSPALQAWYDGETPKDVAPFDLRATMPPEWHRFVDGFRHYHGRLMLYTPKQPAGAENLAIGNLVAPMPGLDNFLFLVGKRNGKMVMLDQEVYGSKLGVEHGPVFDFVRVSNPDRDDILLRWDDSVVGRHSETVSFYKTDGDSLDEYLSIRAWSQEGPAYRGDQPGDSIWYEIERQLKYVYRDADRVWDIKIEGTVAVSGPELQTGPTILKFKETYRWDLEKEAYICDCFKDWPWL